MRLVRIVLGKVAQVVCPGSAEVAAHRPLGPVKQHHRTDVFGIGRRQLQCIIPAQREGHHCQAGLRLSSAFVQEPRGLQHLGPGLLVVGVQRAAQLLSAGDRVGHLAMIKVRGECHETGFGEARADRLESVVQAPPGMQDQYARSLATGWDGQKTIRLGLCHMDSFR